MLNFGHHNKIYKNLLAVQRFIRLHDNLIIFFYNFCFLKTNKSTDLIIIVCKYLYLFDSVDLICLLFDDIFLILAFPLIFFIIFFFVL